MKRRLVAGFVLAVPFFCPRVAVAVGVKKPRRLTFIRPTRLFLRG